MYKIVNGLYSSSFTLNPIPINHPDGEEIRVITDGMFPHRLYLKIENSGMGRFADLSVHSEGLIFVSGFVRVELGDRFYLNNKILDYTCKLFNQLLCCDVVSSKIKPSIDITYKLTHIRPKEEDYIEFFVNEKKIKIHKEEKHVQG